MLSYIGDLYGHRLFYETHDDDTMDMQKEDHEKIISIISMGCNLTNIPR